MTDIKKIIPKIVITVFLILLSPIFLFFLYSFGFAGIYNNIKIQQAEKVFGDFLEEFLEVSIDKKSDTKFGPLGGSGNYCEMRTIYRVVTQDDNQDVLIKLEKFRKIALQMSLKLDYKAVLVKERSMYFFDMKEEQIVEINKDRSYVGPGIGLGSDIVSDTHTWNYIDIMKFVTSHGEGVFLVHSNMFGFNEDDLRCH